MKLKKILLFLLLIADTAFSTQAFDKYTLDREDLPLAAWPPPSRITGARLSTSRLSPQESIS